MFSIRNSHLLVAVAVLLLLGAVSSSQAQQDDSLEDDFKTAPSPGQSDFASTCAGCHGLDGQGSEKGPGIADSPRLQHLSDAQISNIISNGISGTGMPAFRTMTPAQLTALIRYIRVLQGKLAARTIPGDVDRGKGVFFGKGGCSTCHMVSGEGGFLGPDLSVYGSAKSADDIVKALVNPARVATTGYKSAAVTTRDNIRLEGVVRNEDNFSLQLQTPDGSFHFFQKSDLQSVKYLGGSPMPSNYGARLSPGELNDLASYLMSAGSPKADPKSKDR